jgi:DNA repair exonuclease SbcCD ATPase subunit
MKIKFNNFRCYQNAEFEFPDTGMILLSGDSGTGKSTILQGILYALFGSKAVKKPCTFGSNTCTVNLEFNSLNGLLKIHRSTRPNRLVVNDQEDQSAQEIINKKIGMSFTEFMISSFIPQKNNNSILSCTPLEQLEIIKTLSLEGTENYKIKLKETIKTYSLELVKLQTELDFCDEQVNSLQVDPVKDPFTKGIPDSGTISNRIKNYPIKLEKLIRKEKLIFENNSNVEKLFLIEKEIQEIQTCIDNLGVIPDECEKDLIEYIKIILRLNPLKKQYDEISSQEYKEYNDNQVEIKKKILDFQALEILESQLEKCRKQGKLIEKIKTFSNNVSFPIIEPVNGIFIKSLLDYCISLVKYCDAKDLLNCPDCGTKLILQNHKLVHFDNNNDSEIPDFINVAKKDLYISIVEQLKTFPNIEPIEHDENKLSSDILVLKKLKMSVKDYNPSTPLKKMLNDINSLETKLSKMKPFEINFDPDVKLKQLECIESIKTQHYNFTKKMEKLMDQYNIIQDKIIQDLDCTVEEIQSEIITLKNEYESDQKIFEKITRYNEYLKKYKEYSHWVEKQTEITKQLTNTKKIHGANVKLLEKLKLAQIMAFSTTIKSINQYTNFYLEQMFPDNKMIATLKTVESGTVETSIIYKGNEYTSIGQLSGGEFDRCTLASVCGINNMLNSQILMLDESLSALDADTNTEILMFLKEIAQEKLIIVCSHEAVKGIFDNVHQIH